MRLVSLTAFLLLAFSFVGCGGSDEAEGIPKDAFNKPPPPIPGVDLSKGSIGDKAAKKKSRTLLP